MTQLFRKLIAVAAFVLLLAAPLCHAQSFSRFAVNNWTEEDIAATYDHPFIEAGGHVTNAPSDSQVFSWDSYGHVRFNKHDQESPFVAYRILTISAGTDSQYIKSTMDEFDLALGFHLGEIGDWKVATILGMGYSSTHPFVNDTGIFGIGHLTFQKTFDEHNSLLLAIDYEGNGGFLPDVPLPGFAWIHREKRYDAMLGYPISALVWRATSNLEITAQYNVPFTADLDAEYKLATHFGLYANAGEFFQGFVVAPYGGAPEGNITNRQFCQIQRVETGVRFMFGKLVDASVGVGYAFNQDFSTGFDVRGLTPIGQISNEPYLAFVLREGDSSLSHS